MTPPSPNGSPDSADFRGRDIHYRTLAGIVAGLVALMIFAVALNWFLFGYFQEREARDEPPAPRFEAVERALPSPMIAVDPSQERLAMEEEMDALLGVYEWVDPAGSRVRIPIERAMEVLAENGGGLVGPESEEAMGEGAGNGEAGPGEP
jgi:hypothetical protein